MGNNMFSYKGFNVVKDVQTGEWHVYTAGGYTHCGDAADKKGAKKLIDVRIREGK